MIELLKKEGAVIKFAVVVNLVEFFVSNYVMNAVGVVAVPVYRFSHIPAGVFLGFALVLVPAIFVFALLVTQKFLFTSPIGEFKKYLLVAWLLKVALGTFGITINAVLGLNLDGFSTVVNLGQLFFAYLLAIIYNYYLQKNNQINYAK